MLSSYFKKTMKKVWIVLSFYLLILPLSAQEYANQNWRIISDLENIGTANMISFDFDSDGVKELLYSSESSNLSNFKILDFLDDKYTEKYISPIFTGKITWMEIYDLNSDGQNFLYFAKSNSIQVFDFRLNEIIDSINMPVPVEKFYIFTETGDSTQKILFKSGGNILITDLEGNILVQRAFGYITDFDIANVYGDDTKQLVINGSNGHVVKLNDLTTQWLYYGGFGVNLKVFDIYNTGQSMILGAVGSTLVCYDANLKSPVWQKEMGNLKTFDIIDINNDHDFELLWADYDLIKIYNIKTFHLDGQYSLTTPNDQKIIYDDLDGDNFYELAYTSYTNNSGNHILIADLYAYAIEWTSTRPTNGFLLDVIGSENGDSKKMFIGSRNQNNWNPGGGYLYDGKSKERISGFIQTGKQESLNYVKMCTHKNAIYMLSVVSNGFILKNFGTNEIIADYSVPSYPFKADFLHTGLDEKLKLFVSSPNSGTIIYELNDENELVESWSLFSTFQELYDINTGNMDGDLNLEIAVLTPGIISVYDSKTRLLDYQVPVSLAARVFAFADIDFDGVFEFVYGQDNYNLCIIDPETLEITYIPIAENSIKAINISNLDSDRNKEIVMLSRSKVYIFKDNGSLLFTSDMINNSYEYYYRESLYTGDIDDDQHIEIIAATRLGVFEFEINDIIYDEIQPFVKKITPSNGKNLVPTDVTFEVIFSETIQTDSLELKIQIKDKNQNNYSFETFYNAENNSLKIKPLQLLPVGDSITITLFNTIVDLNSNHLDGNLNGLQDGILDNFSWTVHLGEGPDTLGPEIKLIKKIPWVLKGMTFDFSVYCSDSSEIAVSGIEYFEYHINVFSGYGNGISDFPDDLYFGDIVETFSAKASTSGLEPGTHSIYLAGRDINGNWSQVSTIEFDIITEDSTNWPKHGFDDLNRGVNPFSELDLPVILKHSFSHNTINYYQIENSILIQNYLIYVLSAPDFNGYQQFLYCRDINNGNILWKHTFESQYSISPVSYSNGYLYLYHSLNGESKLYCVDLHSGVEVWSQNFESSNSFSVGPYIYKNMVYVQVGIINTEIRAFDAFSGKKEWKKELFNDRSDLLIPVFYNDTMYVYHKKLKAINPQTGDVYYTINENSIPYVNKGYVINSSPVIDPERKIIILTTNTHIHVFSLISKKISLTITAKANDYFISNPSLWEDKLYVISNQYVLEYNLNTGEETWKHKVSESFWYNNPPVVTEKVLACGNKNNSYIFNRSTKALTNILSGGNFIAGKNTLILSTYEDMLKVYLYDSLAIPLSGQLVINHGIDCKGYNTGQLEIIVTGGQKPYSYKWNISETQNSPTLNDLPAGFYIVTVTDNKNSTLTKNIYLSEPTELILSSQQIPANFNTNNGSAIVIAGGGTPPYTYIWDYSSDIKSNMLTNVPAGSYGVKVVDKNGCEKYIMITVDLKVNTGELNLNNCLLIYPTITTDELNVISDQSIQKLTINIRNSFGQMIEMQHFMYFFQHTFSLRNYPEGVYYLQISDGKNNITKKIVLYR